MAEACNKRSSVRARCQKTLIRPQLISLSSREARWLGGGEEAGERLRDFTTMLQPNIIYYLIIFIRESAVVSFINSNSN